VLQDVAAPRRVSYWIDPVRRRQNAAEDAGTDPFAARLPGHPSLDEEAAALAEAAAGRAVDRLADLGVDVLVSANVFLDVLPRGVNKGTTVRRVLQWLGAADERCLVAGDSLNDLALFETGLAAVVVGNAEPALRRLVEGRSHVFLARGEGVAGILEGLRHHGFLSGRLEVGDQHVE
jgi:hydroxymethylpyrimidine pyrophosphatase-like HAD family hydrolase